MAKKTNDDTLLAHLAWMLSSRYEDVAVEALGYILKSASARSALKDLVNGGGTDTGEIVSVQTQVGGEEGSRPDLVGFDRNSNECLIIEAKFWAGLTANQPNTYLNRLPSEKVLLFVVPASRMETLWVELRHRAKVVGSIRTLTNKTGVKSASIAPKNSGPKHLMLTSWPELINHLENASDSDKVDEIRQLKGFVNRIDGSEFSPIGPEELAPELPRRLKGLIQLVDDAITRLEEYGCVDTDGLGRAASGGNYGRYIRIANSGTLFGINIDYWARGSYPDTPLWLRFTQWTDSPSISIDQTREALKPLTHKDSPECFDEGTEVLVPIPLPIEVEYDTVLDAVVERIRSVAELIRSSTGCDISR